MRTLELRIGKVHNESDVMHFFEDNHVQRGDTLKLMSESENKGGDVLIIAMVVILILKQILNQENKRQNQDDGERLLNDPFKGKTIEDIEQQVSEEYGIKIELELKSPQNDENEWNSLSLKNLEKAYEINEPDYNDIQVQEPNPSYDPWKKDQL